MKLKPLRNGTMVAFQNMDFDMHCCHCIYETKKDLFLFLFLIKKHPGYGGLDLKEHLRDVC